MKAVDDLLVLLGIRRERLGAVDERLDGNAKLVVELSETIERLNKRIDELTAENASLRSTRDKSG